MENNLEIRENKKEDKEFIIDLLQEFHQESLSEYGFKFQKEYVVENIEKRADLVLVLLVDNKLVGVIAGVIMDSPIDDSQYFQEVIWYVNKKYRRYGVKLLRHLEKICKDRGYMAVVMVSLANSMAKKLESFYSRCKYSKLETHYIKGLR